jgi:SAM-dependent methyltransferase
MVGVDLSEEGIRNAGQLARQRNLDTRVRFERCDASAALPFADGSFQAIFANDVLCHVPNRFGVLRQIHRVLRPGGCLLFSDALVIGGIISNQEIATRSSIGYYLFAPQGLNERLICDAGFALLEAQDTTESATAISLRWRNAREAHREELVRLEGQSTFDGVQRFLSCVHTLCADRRLLRYVYVARKPA